MIVGLDIGTDKVCAVIGEWDENGVIQVTGIGTSPSEGLRRGVVVNIESTMRSVQAAIESAEMMSGREVQEVVTGIGGNHIEGINSRGVVAVIGKGREINRNDVGRVIEAAKAIVIPMDREVLHVIPQEFIVDDQGGIKDPLDMIGIRLEAEVHIITGSVTSAQNLLKCVNRAGFRVQDIVLQSLASAKAVLSREEKELGVLMIDLGSGTTDILVYSEGAPYYTDVLSLGAHQVTNDVSIMLKTPFESAEKIKCEHGCTYAAMVDAEDEVIIPSVGGWPAASIPRMEICKIIQPRMEEIFEMVRSRLEKKGLVNRLGGGVVITGGGSQLQGTAELAKEVFGIPARIGYPKRVGGLSDVAQSPGYATGVGLVLYAAEFAEEEGARSTGAARTGDGMVGKLRNWFKEFL